MNTLLRIAALIAILAWAGTAFAGNNGKIVGRVTDAKTREPLVGANVTVVGTRMGGATDTEGDYFIANIPAGTYTIRAVVVGYRDVLVQNVRVRPDATTDIPIAMEQTVLNLDQEIVVTAQRPLVAKDNTASRVFVEAGEIQARPAAVLRDVIATLPGIDVEGGVMRVRGGSMNEVAFIVDGARARNPLDQTPYTSINLSSVQEMEVITGAFNAEYGEARSGVFNIITKEGGDRIQFTVDTRYTPPGLRHWGVSLYDRSTPIYWENTHAMHQQWWIDHPDQWVDPAGIYGNDPRSAWTPEQAYRNYLLTHQPLTDYTNTPGYFVEASLGGTVPFVPGLKFHVAGSYRTEPPVMGNSYLDKGTFIDGTAKLTYNFSSNLKLMLTGFFGSEKTSWGIGENPDYFWAQNYGVDSRYAYYDWEGYPTTRTSGQTLKLTHVLNQQTMYEVKLTHVQAIRKREPFPDDPLGWDASDANRDYLRAVETYQDSTGTHTRAVFGGYANRIGFNTTGYYYRYHDRNDDWTLSGSYSSQLTKNIQVKGGGEFTYYVLDHYNEAKSPLRVDDGRYTPYQGAAYAQGKLEFGGFILNLGFRFDFYNPNDVAYSNPWDPLGSTTEPTKAFSQFSPRLGISHPIDEQTVLHFSYGHFFQRGPFGDYGEGNSDAQALGSLTRFVVTGTNDLWVLGNRNVKPEKTISYEIGVERNFFEEFILGVTAYYKDIRNALMSVTIAPPGRTPYRTSGNSSYGDVKGAEISLRKQTLARSWGTTWGYVNYRMQRSIYGRSGDPTYISPTQIITAGSGDNIYYSNPRLKAGVYYQSPKEWSFAWGLLSGVSLSLDYVATFPNEKLFGDYFELGGKKYLRPVDQNTNLKLRKDLAFGGGAVRLGVYVEVRNLFNNKWVNLRAFENTTQDEQQKFVESGFSYLPSYDLTGAPILDLAKFRNLPRWYMIGATLEL